MACGLPVVVSDFGMNHEVLQQDFVGLGAKTEKQWNEALSELIKSPQERKKAGKNGRNVIENFFSKENAAQKWNNVLRTTV